MRRRIGRLARSSARVAGSGLDFIAEGARQIGETGLERIRERRRGRRGHGRQSDRTPLPSLFEVHPEARNYMRREVGLRSIPVDEIAGTAVAGPAQRGSDFKPLPAFRSSNWEARWQRINRANDRLAILPPIDVMKVGDRYWVEDGHNRVAAALANGQVEVDASVSELRPPNAPIRERPTTLAPVLEAGRELRAAGEGRFSAAAASHLATGADEHYGVHAVDDEAHGGEDAEDADLAVPSPPQVTTGTASSGPDEAPGRIERLAAPAVAATDRLVRRLIGGDGGDEDGGDPAEDRAEGEGRTAPSSPP
jgi:hypothetical protein